MKIFQNVLYAIKPGDFKFLYACLCDQTAYSLHFCSFCEHVFMTIYDKNLCSNFKISHQYPPNIETPDLPLYVRNISAQFEVVYAQAVSADKEGLDQIAGLGFRRALEFLVKDYAIYKNPADEEKIKGMPVVQCIDRFITHPRISALAKRAAWLGNDYAHYLKKHTDRDSNDLKELISLTMQWINLELESDAYEKEIEYKK